MIEALVATGLVVASPFLAMALDVFFSGAFGDS